MTAIARRGYWRPRRFAAETGRSAAKRLGCKKPSRRARLAKRSGATGEAGVALRRARLDGGAVFGICVFERARFPSLANHKPANKLDIASFARAALRAL